MNNYEIVLAYHEQTKHHFDRYAKGPAHINWKAQPNAFRHYKGAKRFELPLRANQLETRFVDLYQPGAIVPCSITLDNIATLLELSLAISAWKEYGEHRWALRCNPSSGNLHPTEGYVILPDMMTDIPAGIYHYLSSEHSLEQRGIFGTDGTKINTILSNEGFLLGLTSIPWREAWKYGERAFRYCQLDIGHAIAAIRYAAAALGWKVHLLAHWADAEIITLLGLDRTEDFNPTEREIPEVMLYIGLNKVVKGLSGHSIIAAMKEVRWIGKANQLDFHHHYKWPIIDDVIEATVKPATERTDWQAPPLPPLPLLSCRYHAADLIRQRRSGQTFDGVTPMSRKAFYRLLETTLPRNNVTPWDVFPHQPHLHLVLFVHRVTGLPPGLYMLLRRGIEEKQRVILQSKPFEWVKPVNCPKHLMLYQLVSGDTQNIAQQIACYQEIAADSAFSLSLLAELKAALKKGPWGYKQLFWEAGIIGQILYLEAEAIKARGTGIGCYFDDTVHTLLGLTDTHYQSLYHFTVGTALEDKRLKTLAPYARNEQKKVKSLLKK